MKNKTALFVSILFLLTTNFCKVSAQTWQSLNGPKGPLVTTIAEDVFGHLFTGIISDDNRGIYRSTDHGSNWTCVGYGYHITKILLEPHNRYFAATSGGLLTSNDSGVTWAYIDSLNTEINYMTSTPSGKIYAANSGNIYMSADSGISWHKVVGSMDLQNSYFNALTVDSYGNVYTGTTNGVYRTANNGTTWVRRDTLSGFFYVNALISNSLGYLFAATLDSGIYRSNDMGVSWVKLNTSFGNQGVLSLFCYSNNILFAGTVNGGMYKSSDNGNTWSFSGFTKSTVKEISRGSDGSILTSVFGIGVYRSIDTGATWNSLNATLPFASIYALKHHNGKLYAGTLSNLLRSDNDGLTWEVLFNTRTYTGNTDIIRSIAINSTGTIFAATGYYGLMRSTDNGASWQSNLYQVNSVIVRPNGDILAGVYGGFFRSTDNGNSFTFGNSGLTNINVWVLATDSSGNILAGTQNGLFKSIDNGSSWVRIDSGFTNSFIRKIICIRPNVIFVATNSGGVYRSLNNGASWQQVYTGYTFYIESNSKGEIFLSANYIYRSKDNGDTWTNISSDIPPNSYYIFTLDSQGTIYAGGPSTQGIYRNTCPTTFSVNITPTGPTTFCQNDSVRLVANTGTGYSYIWKNNAALINGASGSAYVARTSGNYKVILSTPGGCTDSSAIVNVRVNPLPMASITNLGPTTFCQGGSVNLVAGNAVSYLWSNALTTKSVAVTTSGNYSVTVTDTNGCRASSTPVTVKVNPLPAKPVISNKGDTLQSTPASSYQWSVNGSIINGAINRTHIAKISGHYKVEIKDSNSCSAVSDSFNIIASGIDEYTNAGLRIYPNPNAGIFKIEVINITGTQDNLLCIYNSIGELILETYFLNSSTEINLQNQPKGIYFIRFVGGMNFINRKIVIQ